MGSTQVGGLGLEVVAEGGWGGPRNDGGHLSSSRTRDGGSSGVTPRTSCLVPELRLGRGGVSAILVEAVSKPVHVGSLLSASLSSP